MFYKWKYFFREICSDEISSTIRLEEGQEFFFFGRGDSEQKFFY